MKKDYPDFSIKKLCGLFGKTRHAWYDRQWREQQDIFSDEIILQTVQKLRQQLPRVGTRKLQELIAPELASHGIEVGRDQFYAMDSIANGILVSASSSERTMSFSVSFLRGHSDSRCTHMWRL